MAYIFRIAEKSFLKRFYSCLLIPLALQILFIYFMSELLVFIFPIFYLPSSNSFAASTGFELCYVSKWKCGLSKYQSPFFDVRCLLLLSCRIFPSSAIYRTVNNIVDKLCSPCFLARFYYFLHSSLSGNLSHGLSSGIMLLSR